VDVRILIDRAATAAPGTELDDAALVRAYAPPALPWLRVNMVSTADGAATGAGGKTGAINNPPDKRVFDLLRATADAIVVGAGTARAERYRSTSVPLVLVSRRGEIPELLREAPRGSVLLATCASAPGLAESRAELGEDGVLVVGESDVDLPMLRETLVQRGYRHLLSEGGPHLLGAMLTAGVVDELCATTVPLLVSGPHPRITAGADVEVPLELALLLEEDGTLLARWFVGS
jgi:riboflavin biosynthesis pyrimidine reductase